MNGWLISPDPELMKMVCQIPLPDYIQTNSWKAKRCLDFFISIFLLIAFLPLIAVLSLLIRLSSSGPVFFQQERISQRGRRYKCIKFRTMRYGADTTPHLKILDRLIAGKNIISDTANNKACYKLRDDPRVTRIGKWIRRFSLDELPQLWNVVRGDISLVGPQAALVFEVERYRIEWLSRFSVPAGLTGSWQVTGRSRVPYAQMIEMDLEYVSKWSLKKDIDLLFKTIFSVLLTRGAY